MSAAEVMNLAKQLPEREVLDLARLLDEVLHDPRLS
jgi:hypothetical protein